MSVVAARVAARAKVNLALRVGPRRDDGYHDLATIFARIDLADDIVVRVLRSGMTLAVHRDGAPDHALEDPAKNLAAIAARAYMHAAGWPSGCGIHIEKRIPVGAGLGGGSADAGAVLRALDSMSPQPLGTAELMRIAARLGADVPFFTTDAEMALGASRGDVIEPLPPLPARAVAVVMPRFSISTADAYGWLDADRGHAASSSPDLESLRDHARDWVTLARTAVNDFQPVIEARHPVIKAYRSALRDAGAVLAMISGSGSAVFGIFEEAPDAAKIGRACDTWAVVTHVPARVVAPPGGE